MNKYNLQNIEGGGFDYNLSTRNKRRVGRLFYAPARGIQRVGERVGNYVAEKVRGRTNPWIDNKVQGVTEYIGERQDQYGQQLNKTAYGDYPVSGG